jgi:hypothetical protein
LRTSKNFGLRPGVEDFSDELKATLSGKGNFSEEKVRIIGTEFGKTHLTVSCFDEVKICVS